MWALLSVMLQWILFGMPGISTIGHPIPEFLLDAYKALTDLFTAQYIY